MALIKKKKIEYYLNEAKIRKGDIRGIYNQILDLTDPFSRISDTGVIDFSSRREIDSSVTEAIDALKSFIMSSLFPRTGNWADIYIDEDKLIETAGEEIKPQLESIKKNKGADLDKVFKYLQSSNYYKEISRAVDSFIKVGTGCYCIRETGSTTKPFIFSYVGLDNLYILEDSLSRPNIVFKLHSDCNSEYLYDLFGKDITLPSTLDTNTLDSKIEVYEIVIPEYNEETTMTDYNYMVMTSDLGTLLKEEQLSYNPFVVFRWGSIEGNPWGKSIVTDSLGLLIELEEYKEIYKIQARRIGNPSAMFTGNRALFDSLTLGEGTITFAGDNFKEGQQGDLRYLSTGSNLMPLDKLIAESRLAFKRKLMVDSLIMNVEQGKNTTATYVQYMQEMFRKRFSDTYESINFELLSPTFLTPFTIMLKNRMLQLKPDIIPYANITYINELSKATDIGDVNGLLQYTQIISGLNQAQGAGVILDAPKANTWIATKMGINKELLPTEEELRTIQQMRMQQQQQQLQQQQGEVIPNE